MLKKEDFVELIKYGYYRSAIMHVQKHLQQKGLDASEEAAIDALAEKAMRQYLVHKNNDSYVSRMANLDYDKEPQKVVKLVVDNIGTLFPVTNADGTSSASSGGCYVATCVYGSYDCPQVWTLRRYRDDTLGATRYGRAFIHTYYAVSPTLVKWFGKSHWFKKMWKRPLDSMVRRLQKQGVADTPYCDRDW